MEHERVAVAKQTLLENIKNELNSFTNCCESETIAILDNTVDKAESSLMYLDEMRHRHQDMLQERLVQYKNISSYTTDTVNDLVGRIQKESHV